MSVWSFETVRLSGDGGAPSLGQGCGTCSPLDVAELQLPLFLVTGFTGARGNWGPTTSGEPHIPRPWI